MDELRWLLLILAVAFVAAVYGFSRWQEARRARPQHRAETFDELDFDDALDELDTVVSDEGEPFAVDAGADAEVIQVERREPAPRQDSAATVAAELKESLGRTVAAVRRRKRASDNKGAPEPDPAAVGEEKVVVINVLTSDRSLIEGVDLVALLESVGLRYGEQKMFERVVNGKQGPVTLFAAANVLKPGTFDLDALDEMLSPGVAFFLQLPGPFDGLDAFEQMLLTARRVAEAIDGQLLDARRCTLTNQAIEHIREELLEYRRLAHLAARQAR